MIEYVEGQLVEKAPQVAVIQVGGFGLRLSIPASTFDVLPRTGASVRLLAHLEVREDDLSLFGFGSSNERHLFRLLLGVSGISTTIALRALGSCSVAEFKRIVLDEEVDTLQHMIKGVGKKTAQRMVLELKEPIAGLAVEPARSAAGRAARDVVDGLMQLGWSRLEAERAVRAALEELGPDVDREQLLNAAVSK